MPDNRRTELGIQLVEQIDVCNIANALIESYEEHIGCEVADFDTALDKCKLAWLRACDGLYDFVDQHQAVEDFGNRRPTGEIITK